MPTHASQDVVPSEGTSTGDLSRRRFLTYVVAAPVLTVAASSGLDLIAPSKAHAVVPSPPQPENLADLGDVMVAATKQAQDLLVLEVTKDNRIVFRLPRAEVGQGITTALAMVVADEIDARLVDVDVPLEDARQDLGTAQSTGGSSSVRSLWDPVRSIAAEARARLVTAAAERWDLPARSLTTRDTAVWAPDGRSATYGSLTEAAAKVSRASGIHRSEALIGVPPHRQRDDADRRTKHRDRGGEVRARCRCPGRPADGRDQTAHAQRQGQVVRRISGSQDARGRGRHRAAERGGGEREDLRPGIEGTVGG